MADLRIGQNESMKRVFSQEVLNRFAMISGDDNPIHVDPEFSARTKFGKTVVHGMLLYSAISAAIGKWFPNGGFIQLSQELMFPSPTFVNEMVEIRLKVTAFPTADTVEITTVVAKPDGGFGCTGITLISCIKAQTRVEMQANKPPSYTSEINAYRGLRLGQSASRTSVFTKGPSGQLETFLDLVDDGNLLYKDPAFARTNRFDDVILPGGLLGGMISDLLGTELPGRGTNWLKQRFEFLRPAYPESAITANVEIVRLRPEKDLVNLRTTCVDPTGDLIMDGEALVWVSDLERGQ